EHLDTCADAILHLGAGLERRHRLCPSHVEHVTLDAEARIIGGGATGNVLIEGRVYGATVVRHLHVLAVAEQPAHTADRAGCGGVLIGRIWLDHSDVASDTGTAQMIGNARAHDAAADDGDPAHEPPLADPVPKSSSCQDERPRSGATTTSDGANGLPARKR